jgi:ABC-type transport system involved in multi-copper enzyme maturation permease subunit
MSFGRIWVIAKNVFWETIRDRILYLVGLFAIVFILAVVLLPDVAAGTQDKILLDIGMAAISLIGLVVAVFVGTTLINKEIEKRTVLVLLSKPVSRGEFIIGKHLGLTAVIAVLLALMTAIYFGALYFREIAFPVESLLIAVLFLLLQLSLIIAVAILFGSFTSSLLSALFTFGIYLMGNFSRDLVELGKLSEGQDVQRIADGLYLILPDLSRLDLKNLAVYGMAALPPVPTLLIHAGYGLLYTLLLLGLTIFIFSRRQF